MMSRTRHGWKQVRHKNAGMNLIELLVVITIIGVLMSLLLPAMQTTREAARRMYCANNVKQLAMAALSHESHLGFFPTGGWHQDWLGHPGRGFGKSQPGGWVYNILPFVDQQSLHDMGDGNGMTIEDANAARLATPLSLMNCPSRRPAVLYRLHSGVFGIRFKLTNDVITPLARSDYAVNAGDYIQFRNPGKSPNSLEDADAKSATGWDNTSLQTGICYQRSQITMADVRDGTTFTFLVGEKHVNARHYTDGDDPGDTTTMYSGGDLELLRWTGRNGKAGKPPMQDIASIGVGDHGYWFGSAHASGLNMSFCDGSVATISYSVDPEVYRRLGNRKDDLPIDGSQF